MKVLYLIDSLEGYGAEKSIVQIALNLNMVIPVFVHIYQGDKLKPILQQAGIKVYSLNIPTGTSFKKAFDPIVPIIEIEKPQAIHSMLFRADMVARYLKNFYPKIFLIGSFVSNSYGKKRYAELSVLSKIKLFRTQLIDRFSSNKVDYFICNSYAIKETNIKALNIPSTKIEVIYRGRNFDDYSLSRVNFNTLRRDLSPHGKSIFLNVGRLLRSKGQLDLLMAFKNLVYKEPNNILLFAGEGSYRKVLEKKIVKFGLEKNVFLLGYREDIPELLAASDFFVFPSYYEGLPGALIEAIIAKKPSIVSDIPENKECFKNGGALFFPPGNIAELANKMEEAINLKDWKIRLESSYKYAEKNFKINNVSRDYEAFYKKILSK